MGGVDGRDLRPAPGMVLIEIAAQAREASSAMALERLREVCKFFEESFRSPELYQFLSVNEYQAVAAAVNRAVGDTQYVFGVVQALDQRGLINAELFARLRKER